MREIIVGRNEEGQRMDKLLKKYLKEASSGFLYKMLRKKNITLNHKKAEGKEILHSGDVICIYFSEETLEKFTGKREANSIVEEKANTDFVSTEYDKAYKLLKHISLIYEDEDIILLNKPRGILSQKTDKKDLSLNEWMIGYLLKNRQISFEQLQTFRPSICNRLDRNTSGLVICGKSLQGSREMNQWIKERKIEKYYRCFLKGTLTQKMHLKDYIKKDELNNIVHISSIDKTGYFPIETKVTPLSYGKDLTYAEVELITGKSHQIRAHLGSIGYPLLGDEKYGDHHWNENFYKLGLPKGQLLHAYRIIFPLSDNNHPLSGREFKAPEPFSFEKIKKEYL